MKTLKVYQIGLGGFGRYGFEKLVDMHNHFDRKVNVEFCGVAERDFQKREDAKKFAQANGIGLEFYPNADELYRDASMNEEEVLVYDAGPSAAHAEHIYESINRGFFHLAEKPPSITREEHLKERKLAEEKDVFWMVDFIERESPVVRKTEELLESEEIEEINVFRESSVGVQKVLEPVERSGVQGGDILDKMTHEIYVLDFLEAAGINSSLQLVDADSRYFMPKDFVSDKFMSVRGGYTTTIDDTTATGQTRANFRANDTEVNLHSGWMGISDLCRKVAGRIDEATDHSVVDSEYHKSSDNIFWNGEARFFEVKGSLHLVGDMLHGKLFDMESGEELETPVLMHDQLYRVIEKAILNAAGMESGTVDIEDIGNFMGGIFDARDSVFSSSRNYTEELEKAKKRLREHVIDTEKENVLEDEVSEGIIGV